MVGMGATEHQQLINKKAEAKTAEYSVEPERLLLLQTFQKMIWNYQQVCNSLKIV